MKFFLLVALFAYTGCVQNRQEIKRTDTKKIGLVTIHWGSNDLQEIAQQIVQNILSSTAIDFSKSYSFGKIRNDTYDHIDTKLLINKIISALVKSHKVKISENKNHNIDGIFYGKISSIFKKNKKGKDMFFNFSLNLSDIKTTTVVWSEEVEIRKVYKKELIGW